MNASNNWEKVHVRIQLSFDVTRLFWQHRWYGAWSYLGISNLPHCRSADYQTSLIKQKSMKRSPSPLFTVHAAALLTWGVFLSASFNTESKQWRSFHRTFPHPNLSFFKSRAAKYASRLFKMRQPARGTFSFSCYEKQTWPWSTGLQLAERKRIASYLKPCYI